MSVTSLYAKGETYNFKKQPISAVPERFHEIAEFAILASQPDPFDPMDRAIRQLGEEALQGSEHLHTDWTVARDYPLGKGLLAISEVWSSPDSRQFVIAAKAAPEAIADLCHLPQSEAEHLNATVATMAAEGLRVLGVAKAHSRNETLPDKQHDFEFEFLGLVGLADPVRPTVPSAVRECRTAGIRVVMITGDYPGTAMSIARQIGLQGSARTITGPGVAAIDDQTLRDRVATSSVFVRAVPGQKLQLLNALKVNGEIVRHDRRWSERFSRA